MQFLSFFRVLFVASSVSVFVQKLCVGHYPIKATLDSLYSFSTLCGICVFRCILSPYNKNHSIIRFRIEFFKLKNLSKDVLKFAFPDCQ